MVKGGFTPNAAQNAETKSQDRFFDGKAAMMWNGNWVVSAALKSPHKNDFTVVPLPKAPSGERKTVIHGIANVMSAKSKNPEAAAAFLAFLGGKDAALIQAKAGAANPAYTGTQTDFVNSAPQYNLKTYIEAAAAVRRAVARLEGHRRLEQARGRRAGTGVRRRQADVRGRADRGQDGRGTGQEKK